MDRRPIGVFDSGLGGLTAVQKLIELLPGEDILYLGDTGRLPYGGKSRETIIRYAREDAAFLLRRDVKAIVVACGTVSTNAIKEVTELCPVPVMGIVENTARRAVSATKTGRIGVIATSATIRSGSFGTAIRSLMPQAQVTEKACPLFVPLVEDGRIRPGEKLIELCAEEYLAPLMELGIDTLVLGCTHYPLLTDVLSGILGPGVTLVNSGAETALAMAELLREKDLLSGKDTEGTHSYFVTDSTEGFGKIASLFLGGDVTGSVVRADILS